MAGCAAGSPEATIHRATCCLEALAFKNLWPLFPATRAIQGEARDTGDSNQGDYDHACFPVLTDDAGDDAGCISRLNCFHVRRCSGAGEAATPATSSDLPLPGHAGKKLVEISNSEIAFRNFVHEIYEFAGRSRIRKLDIGPATERPKPLSKADLALECTAIKSADGDLVFGYSLISAFVEQGDTGNSRGETLAVGSWTLRRPDADQQDQRPSSSKQNSEGGDLIGLLNLGSDKIAIAWTLGEAWNSHAHIDDTKTALEGMSNLSKDDAAVAEFAKDCTGLKPQAIKDGAYQVVEDMVYLAEHLTRMQAGATLENVMELLPKVIGKPDFQAKSVDLFDAPREVVDAYRAGMAFSVLELHGDNTCMQQRFQKAFRACAGFRDKFSLRTSQTDSESFSRLSAVLAEYGVQLKLPTVECAPDSQKAFRLYVEEIKRTAQKAMRVRYNERSAKSSEK